MTWLKAATTVVNRRMAGLDLLQVSGYRERLACDFVPSAHWESA